MRQNQTKLPNRFRINTENFTKFTFRERLKILLGYNLTAQVDTAIDKRDGRCWQRVKFNLTALRTADAQIQENYQSTEE